MEEDCPLPLEDPGQRKNYRVAKSVYAAILLLRANGLTVEREGRQHVIDGKRCDTAQLMRIARGFDHAQKGARKA